MFVVVIKPKGDHVLNMHRQLIGPFNTHFEAEEALCLMPPASRCEYKYIERLAAAFSLASFEDASKGWEPDADELNRLHPCNA